MDIVLGGATLALVMVGLWYSWETRKLVRQTIIDRELGTQPILRSTLFWLHSLPQENYHPATNRFRYHKLVVRNVGNSTATETTLQVHEIDSSLAYTEPFEIVLPPLAAGEQLERRFESLVADFEEQGEIISQATSEAVAPERTLGKAVYARLRIQLRWQNVFGRHFKESSSWVGEYSYAQAPLENNGSWRCIEHDLILPSA